MHHDPNLHRNVLAALEFDPSIDATHIGVGCAGGVVTLTGQVRNYAEKITAERVVKGVVGVQAVANDITVHLTAGTTRSDTEIAEAAVGALAWDAEIPENAIKITVANGWVTLHGAVEWWYQRNNSERAVRRLIGVKGVANQVQVTPKLNATNVKARIESALKRSAEVEADRIQIATQGGRVVLNGKVNSWVERSVVEEAAWAVPGVSAVEDHLLIGA